MVSVVICPLSKVEMFTSYQRQQASSATPAAQNWPASLKEYTSKCFSACTTTEDKDMVEIILKGKIAATAATNTLWSKDWSKEELPGVLCRRSGGKSKLEMENRALKESKRLLEVENETLVSKNQSLNVLVERLEERVKCPVCMEVPRCGQISSLSHHNHVITSSYPCSGPVRSSAAPWATWCAPPATRATAPTAQCAGGQCSL